MKFRISHFGFRGGFTLLEIVVAMAIVGLGVVTLLQIFSLGLRLEARSLSATEAVSRARAVMDEVLIRRGIEEGREEGSSGERHRWQLQIRGVEQGPNPVPEVGLELKDIALRMRYPDGGREREVEMRTLRLVKRNSP